MANYKDWIDAIDIKVDYFSAFMKAWIAFNAWYESSEVEGKTDKEKIDYISSKTNRFRTYLSNLLIEQTVEGNSYRENVAQLHASLLGAAITTQAFVGVRQTISFSEIAVKDQNNRSQTEYYSLRYQCLRAAGKLTTTIVNKTNNVEVFKLEQEEYDEEAIKQQASFAVLTYTQKSKCLDMYKQLFPYLIESVLDTSETAIKMGAYSFVNDADKVSGAIVKILYSLRCALAHGDISPDTHSNSVYRYAYEVLVPPLKKLK